MFEMGMLKLTWWHSIALTLWVEKIDLCSLKSAKVSSTIKGYQFYFNSLSFGEILKCILKNKVINTAPSK